MKTLSIVLAIALGASLLGNLRQSVPQPNCSISQVAYFDRYDREWKCEKPDD